MTEGQLLDADWELVHELRLRGVIENPDPDRVGNLLASGFATMRTTTIGPQAAA